MTVREITCFGYRVSGCEGAMTDGSGVGKLRQ